MREIIDLLEEKEQLERYELAYGCGSFAPVLSKPNIENHYDKLYKGYVDRFNQGEGDAAFNRAGAYLHNIWFKQLRPPKNANTPFGASLALINKHYTNFLTFKREFESTAMAFQGAGWIYLARDGAIKTIRNHTIKTDIALLVDWWEHAWILDYAANKKKYLSAQWRIVNWEMVNRRIYSGQ
jgi:Fe-Mn family superoxide dismutase